MVSINTNISSLTFAEQPRKVVPKGNVEKSASNPTSNSGESPKFRSPFGNIDSRNGTYSVEFRDTSTGEVKFQYPNNKAATEYLNTASREANQSHKIDISTRDVLPVAKTDKPANSSETDKQGTDVKV